jgi:yeast amino acid transporter
MAGRATDDLPFAAMFGVAGSYVGLALVILCLIAQFYVSLWPIGGSPNAEYFFENYLAAPIVIAFFLGYKLFYKQWSIGVDLRAINLDEGRRNYDAVAFKEEMDAERAEQATWPTWKKIWNTVC